MRAVVGLGNPGPRYAPTRHNLGFWVLERLLPRAPWARALFDWGEVYQGRAGFLLRPLTFMNASGHAVRQLVAKFALAPQDLLVVYDDADLPLGELRLRPRGGPGTHNGMRSVIEALGTEDIPRLRVGLGQPPGVDWAPWVLSPPTAEEAQVLAQAADEAAELAWVFLDQGLQAALDRFSRRSQAA